jgi:GxxExxY protein
LQFELVERWLRAERQNDLHVAYCDVRIDCGDRIDLLVEHRIIVELKAVAKLEPNQEVPGSPASGCRAVLWTC